MYSSRDYSSLCWWQVCKSGLMKHKLMSSMTPWIHIHLLICCEQKCGLWFLNTADLPWCIYQAGRGRGRFLDGPFESSQWSPLVQLSAQNLQPLQASGFPSSFYFGHFEQLGKAENDSDYCSGRSQRKRKPKDVKYRWSVGHGQLNLAEVWLIISNKKQIMMENI